MNTTVGCFQIGVDNTSVSHQGFTIQSGRYLDILSDHLDSPTSLSARAPRPK